MLPEPPSAIALIDAMTLLLGPDAVPEEPERRTNPVAPRADSGPLYRGVSPPEMADILRTGRIVGRGNYFSGDPREHLVFFGEDGPDAVSDQSLDVVRTAQSEPAFVARSRALAELERDLEERNRRHELPPLWRPDPAGDALRREDARLASQRRRLQEALYDRADALRARYDRLYGGVYGFVVALEGVPGGVRYTGADSWHQGTEVGLPRDPRRERQVHHCRLPGARPRGQHAAPEAGGAHGARRARAVAAGAAAARDPVRPAPRAMGALRAAGKGRVYGARTVAVPAG
jgi:hypothetical protein